MSYSPRFLSFILGSSLLAMVSCGEAGKVIADNSPSPSETAQTTPETPTNSNSSSSSTGFPARVKAIETEANQTIEIKGNLSEGEVISDLSWAAQSNVACFPATQNAKFKANHVLYHTALPPRSILNVKLIPDNPEGPAMSLYGYQIGASDYDVVPALSSAVTCEADHINDRPVRGKVEDGTRSLYFNATTNPYNVVIAVTGVEGASGGYTLQIELEQ